MAGSIKVDPQVLRSTASKIDSRAGEYRKQYSQLFSEVEGMQAAWQGPDSLAAAERIKAFKADFERMAKLMEEYSAFLKRAADSYQSTQDDIKAAWKRQ